MNRRGPAPAATAAPAIADSGPVLSPALDSPTRGILYVVVGVSIFSAQDVVIKGLSGAYPVHEIVFVRSAVALALLLPLVWRDSGLAALRTRRPGLHLFRGAAAFLAYSFYYLALAALPLAEVMALYFSAPLFVIVLSVAVLRETVAPRRWIAVGVGFAGVMVMLQPGVGAVEPAGLLAIAAAFTYAITAIVTRRLGSTDGGAVMAFHVTLFYLGASAIVGLALGVAGPVGATHESAAFLMRPWRVPPWPDLGLMALCGAIAAFGFYFLSQAYRVAPAATVAPFEYVALLWAVAWGYAVWGDLPAPQTWAGVALVVGSGFYLFRREAQRGRAAAAGRGVRLRR